MGPPSLSNRCRLTGSTAPTTTTNAGSLTGTHNASDGAVRRSLEESLETFDIFLEKTAIYWPVLRDRFWLVFDQLSGDFREPTSHMLSAPEVLGVLSERYQTLTGFFGETVVQQELSVRLTPEDFYGVLRRAQGRRYSLSLTLLKHEESPVRTRVERAERVLRRYGETPIKTVPRTFTRASKPNLPRLGA